MSDFNARHLLCHCSLEENQHFRKKITDAAKRYISAGYIPEVRPNFPTEAAKFVDERDVLRVSNHHIIIKYHEDGEGLHTNKMESIPRKM